MKRHHSDSILNDYNIINNNKTCNYQCDECQLYNEIYNTKMFGNKCNICDKFGFDKGICKKCVYTLDNNEAINSIFKFCILITTVIFATTFIVLPIYGTILFYNSIGIELFEYTLISGFRLTIMYIILFCSLNYLSDYASWFNMKLFNIIRIPFTYYLSDTFVDNAINQFTF